VYCAQAMECVLGASSWWSRPAPQSALACLGTSQAIFGKERDEREQSGEDLIQISADHRARRPLTGWTLPKTRVGKAVRCISAPERRVYGSLAAPDNLGRRGQRPASGARRVGALPSAIVNNPAGALPIVHRRSRTPVRERRGGSAGRLSPPADGHAARPAGCRSGEAPAGRCWRRGRFCRWLGRSRRSAAPQKCIHAKPCMHCL